MVRQCKVQDMYVPVLVEYIPWEDKLYLVDFAKEEAGLDACLIAKTRMG